MSVAGCDLWGVFVFYEGLWDTFIPLVILRICFGLSSSIVESSKSSKSSKNLSSKDFEVRLMVEFTKSTNCKERIEPKNKKLQYSSPILPLHPPQTHSDLFRRLLAIRVWGGYFGTICKQNFLTLKKFWNFEKLFRRVLTNRVWRGGS